MHDFGRTPVDIIRIVKIHESTLRKRLLEFGDTPSSVLTIDEFMTVDLEAEQDPPAFKAARKKDKELIQKIADNEQEFSELQREIEAHLESDLNKKKRRLEKQADGKEGSSGAKNAASQQQDDQEESQFIQESITETITGCLNDPSASLEVERETVEGIGPWNILEKAISNTKTATTTEQPLDADTILDDLEDDEINSYILDEAEAKRKNEMWTALNAEYLEEVRLRQERVDKEREEGKPEKKRKKVSRKSKIEPSSTAGEAIEKILQEKKISSKINYDILRSLTGTAEAGPSKELLAKVEKESEPTSVERSFILPSRRKLNPILSRRRVEVGLPVATEADQEPKLEKITETGGEINEEGAFVSCNNYSFNFRTSCDRGGSRRGAGGGSGDRAHRTFVPCHDAERRSGGGLLWIRGGLLICNSGGWILCK